MDRLKKIEWIGYTSIVSTTFDFHYFFHLQIHVPRGAVGIIIGREGAMIKKIQTETGARVQFKEGE